MQGTRSRTRPPPPRLCCRSMPRRNSARVTGCSRPPGLHRASAPGPLICALAPMAAPHSFLADLGGWPWHPHHPCRDLCRGAWPAGRIFHGRVPTAWNGFPPHRGQRDELRCFSLRALLVRAFPQGCRAGARDADHRRRPAPRAGGFDGRYGWGAAEHAAAVAKAVSRPVTLIWTCEDDLFQGFHRPAQVALMRAGIDTNGRVIAFHFLAAGPVHRRRPSRRHDPQRL